MKLTGTSNENIFGKFAGKSLIRINTNTFVTADGSDGFRTSDIVQETRNGNQLTICTQNSSYVFAVAEEPACRQTQMSFFSLLSGIPAVGRC